MSKPSGLDMTVLLFRVLDEDSGDECKGLRTTSSSQVIWNSNSSFGTHFPLLAVIPITYCFGSKLKLWLQREFDKLMIPYTYMIAVTLIKTSPMINSADSVDASNDIMHNFSAKMEASVNGCVAFFLVLWCCGKKPTATNENPFWGEKQKRWFSSLRFTFYVFHPWIWHSKTNMTCHLDIEPSN